MSQSTGPFTKKVQRSQVASPFRREFDITAWFSSYESSTARTSNDEDLFRSGLHFDEKLKNVWRLYDSLDLKNIDPKRLRRAVVAAANRERIVLSEKFREKMGQLTVDKTLVFEELNSSRLRLPSGGEYNIDDLMASVIDGALLPLRRSYEPNSGRRKTPEPILIRDATMLGQLHYLLLALWEDCSWRGYVTQRDDNEVTVCPKDMCEAKNCAESLSRYYARISETYIQCTIGWRELPRHVKERIYARSVEVEVAGLGRKMKFIPHPYRPQDAPPRSALLRFCGSELYFEGILKLPLPKCGGLSLDHLLELWEVLYAVVKALSKKLPEDTGPKSSSDLDKFAPLIPKGALIEIFSVCSGSNYSQCRTAVDFLTFSKEQPEELWPRPLVECERGMLAPVIGSVLEGNPLRMIEKWMKLGGLDLGERGGKFESHCREEVEKSIKKSSKLKKSGVLPHAYKFGGGVGDPGDIDIVIWIGETILIGEIKCNLFPTRGSEKRRHLEDMHSAAGQIKRKLDAFRPIANSFYQSIANHSPQEDLRIIPFILTNVSLGVGMHFSDIPVTDLLILSRYLDMGSMDKHRRLKRGSDDTGGYRIHFYDSEKEASNRIETYLSDPPQLWHYKDSTKMERFPIPALDIEDIPWHHADFVVDIDGDQFRNNKMDREEPSRFKYRTELL